MTRLDEIKKSSPMIAKELEKLINTIASNKNNINDEDEINISHNIILLKDKFVF